MRYSSCRDVILSLPVRRGLGEANRRHPAQVLCGSGETTSHSHPVHADVFGSFSMKKRLIFSWGPVCSKQQPELRQTICFSERGSCRGATGPGRGWRVGPPPLRRPSDTLSHRPLGSSKQTPHRFPQERQIIDFTTLHDNVKLLSRRLSQRVSTPPGCLQRQQDGGPAEAHAQRRPSPRRGHGAAPAPSPAGHLLPGCTGFGRGRAKFPHSSGCGSMFRFCAGSSGGNAGCVSHRCTVLTQPQGLFLLLTPRQQGPGGTRVWEGTRTGKPTPTDQGMSQTTGRRAQQ